MSATCVTDTTQAPFHLLDLGAATDAGGIPQPSGEPTTSAEESR
ncbi:MAG: hypothetical protein ACO38P_08360 [Phycisphaerales bacterium]